MLTHSLGVRFFRVFMAGLVATATAGCLQPSLNPLFLVEEAVFDERLVGTWRCGDETWTLGRTDAVEGPANAYSVRVRADDQEGRLVMWLGRLSGRTFATFAPDDIDLGVPPFAGAHLVGAATFGRIEIGADRVELRMLDSEWISTAHTAGLLTIGRTRQWSRAHDDAEVVLTATTAELQRFASAYAQNDDVFGERIVLARVRADGNAAATVQGQCYADK